MSGAPTMSANGTAGAVTLAAPTAPAALPEAPASVTVKLDYRGFDVLLTLRDHDGRAVLERLDAALTFLEGRGATSTRCAHNGGQTASTPSDAPMCPTHGSPMRQGRRGWYCPVKLIEDGGDGRPLYCKATAPAGGAS